jgi:hypothetical protein
MFTATLTLLAVLANASPAPATDTDVPIAQRRVVTNRDPAAAERVQRELSPGVLTMHNKPMRDAGIVFTAIGSGLLIAAAVTNGLNSGCHGDFCGMTTVFIGLPLMGGGLLFALVGIPLWAVGGRYERVLTCRTRSRSPSRLARRPWGCG